MSEASMESDGTDVFVVYNGVRIAKRGNPKLVLGFRSNPVTKCLTRITPANWSLSATAELSAISSPDNFFHLFGFALK
jgi:hypothetical protein